MDIPLEGDPTPRRLRRASATPKRSGQDDPPASDLVAEYSDKDLSVRVMQATSEPSSRDDRTLGFLSRRREIQQMSTDELVDLAMAILFELRTRVPDQETGHDEG